MTTTEAAGSPGDPRALVACTDKWRARWPEWSVAEAFVPRRQRAVALAWASLQQELTDAAWAGDDPRPGEAKLGWWQEELAGWSRGARRHPLGAVLQPQAAQWTGLAAALPALGGSRERSVDPEHAQAALRDFAAAVLAIEADLFVAGRAQGGGAQERGGDVVVATLLQSRLLHGGDQGIPLSVLAKAGDGDRRALWAAQLYRQWPAGLAATRPRRLWAALARARLAGPDPGRPLPSRKVLLQAWRAARG